MDVEAAIEHVVATSSYPGRRAWAQEHLTAAASDVEALAPRDGRATA